MKKYYKYLFLSAAWWNCLIGVIFSLGYKQIFQFLGMIIPNYPVIVQLASSFVFVFGVGCYWASKDMFNNTAAIKLSIIGRLVTVILFSFYVLRRDIHPFFMVIVFIDLVFSILFLQALRISHIKKNNITREYK